ncbi:MAG TPA: hypothetical protein VNH83_14455, partial [Bryobacteraceae bacterium]|nr:hypothetical protein [Bryobacteraceae bacterium]
ASGAALLSPESIGSIYGASLSPQAVSADSPGWPTSLGGVQLTVQDKTGQSRLAPLAYVSPSQINFEIPAGTAIGSATLLLQNASGTDALGTVRIAAAAPALFSANASGTGVAAATAVKVVLPSPIQSPLPVFTCDQSGSCKAVPIAIGVDTPVYISFYGTGIRGRTSLSNVAVTIGGVSAPVLYAGPQGTYPGLDQVNVGLPLSLQGAGVVDVNLTVDGLSANTVQIAVQ